jgi:hypothetical protein
MTNCTILQKKGRTWAGRLRLASVLSSCVLSTGLWAQCNSGALISGISPTAVFQTVNVPAGAPLLNDPSYFTFTGTAGTQYTFTYCQGGGSSGYDSYLTVTNDVGTSVAFVDDFCSLSSEVSYTPGVTGTYRVYTSACCPCSPRSSAATLAYRGIAAGGNNDACAGALPVLCGVPVAGTTTGSTVDTYPTCGSAQPAHPGVWYSIVGDGGQFTASLCGSAYDTQISVFSGTCGALNCIIDNDDDCGLQSQVNWAAANGTTYYILVHGYNGSTGTFSLNVTCAAPCSPSITNDFCVNALSIPINGAGCTSTVSGNTNCATPEAPNPGCFSPFATLPDVWYTFTPATTDLSLTITYGTATSLGYVIYSGSCAGTQVTCNAFLTSGSPNTLSGLTPGQPHYLRVLGPLGSRGSFTACLSLLLPSCANYTAPSNGSSAEAAGTTLSWNAASFATGYLFYLGTDGGGVALPTNVANGTDLGNVLSVASGALAVNTVYYWAVVPYNAVGSPVGCAIWSFNTSAPACVNAPTAPTNGGVACSGGGTTLSWPASPGATGYDVTLNGNVVSTNQAGTTYAAGILASGPHTWSVTPLNGNGPATGCPTWNFSIISSPPGDVLATAIALDLAPAGTTSVAGNNLSVNCFTNNIGSTSPDVFYSFNSGACASTVSLDLCTNFTFDNYLRLYDATGTILLAASDDVCGAGASIQNFAISPNTDYIIVAEGFGGNEGTYTLSVALNCFCTSPAGAVSDIVEDCNGGTFTLDVDVTSTGSTPDATISYTVNGGAPVLVNGVAVGTTTIPTAGTFLQGDDVSVTLQTSNGLCTLPLGAFTDNCPYQITCGTTIPVSYCYKNADPKTFTFLADNPNETVTVTFVSGMMATNDLIRAYSGTDNNGDPIPELTGNFANLANASGSSSGPALYIEIESDASGSCFDGDPTASTWVFEAECTAGCVDPNGGVTLNASCSTIDVEVTDLGDGASTTLSYNVNGGAFTDITGLEVGSIEQIGPFTAGQSVQIFLLHETDGACNRNLGSFVIPAQPNPVTLVASATPATICPGSNSQLQAAALVSAGVLQYAFTAQTGATLDPMAGATNLGVAGDDSGSGLNPIGFTFRYDNADFTTFSANSNGVMRFGALVGADYINTNAFQPAALYALWDDHSAVSVTTVLVGSAPNRIRIINYNLNISFATNSNIQVWLYETTNAIEFRYGSAASTFSATVAIVGNNTAQWQSLQSFAAPSVSSAVRNNALNGWPGAGQMYRFAPPTAVAAYTWSPDTFLSDAFIANPVASNVTATTEYTVTAVANGCTYITTVTLTVAEPIEAADITPAVASICAGTPVTLTAVPTGGLAPYTYAWTDPNNVAAGTASTVSASIGGVWSVDITDFCDTQQSANRAVNANPVPTASISSNSPVCSGGTLNLTCNTDIGTSFVWTGPAPVGGSTSQTVNVPNATVLSSGAYGVVATANGCSSLPANATITVNQSPIISAISATPPAICEGENAQLSVVAVGPPPGLAAVLNAINAGSASLVASIPTPSGFSMDLGVNSFTISDGCSDMYDGGNFLNTNLGANLNYSDNAVVGSAALGAGGQYFTRYIGPGGCQGGPATLFFWAGDVSGISSISITGNLGADGSGTQQLSSFTVSANGITYTVLLKRVFNAFDPSVNQMFLIPQPNSAAQSMGASTDNNLHTITGLTGVTRFYYLLYAGASGALINDAQATTIAQTFANLLPTGALTYAWSNGGSSAITNVTSPDGYSVTITDPVTNCFVTGNITVLQDQTDTDGDGVIDCEDDCPTVDGEIGSPCDDGNPNTIFDEINNDCECAGSSCVNDLNLAFQLDGVSVVTYELRDQGTNAIVQTDVVSLPVAGELTDGTCLPNGCFYLRVLDDNGDGIANGGYILRLGGGSNKRIIDNRNNFTSGAVSAIASNQGFCLPLGTDRLIYTSCDKLDWLNNQYIVATDNQAVTNVWNNYPSGSTQRATTGYEMWWFNPNGGYSFRRFQSHATTNGMTANAVRACHFKINSWSGNQLQNNVLYNVRVRSRVIGANSEWGATCRFRRSTAGAACPQTKLMDLPGNQYYSCGATRTWGGSSLVHARPVTFVPAVSASLVRYQFRFRIAAEGFEVIRTSNNYYLPLNWGGATALQPGKTYDVDVRVSKNSGTSWCVGPNNPVPFVDAPWGDVCQLTIAVAAQGGNQNFATQENAAMQMYPNPNRGDQLYLNMEEIDASVNTVSMDFYDSFGKRVSARTFAVADGFINTVVELNGELAAGLYMVNITAGETVYTERLVIQP